MSTDVLDPCTVGRAGVRPTFNSRSLHNSQWENYVITAVSTPTLASVKETIPASFLPVRNSEVIKYQKNLLYS